MTQEEKEAVVTMLLVGEVQLNCHHDRCMCVSIADRWECLASTLPTSLAAKIVEALKR